MHLSVAVALYLFVPLCCLWGVSSYKQQSDCISKDITLRIRGCGMLLIVFVHAIENYINPQTFFIYVSGVIGVASCFLVSGYGLLTWLRYSVVLAFFNVIIEQLDVANFHHFIVEIEKETFYQKQKGYLTALYNFIRIEANA